MFFSSNRSHLVYASLRKIEQTARKPTVTQSRINPTTPDERSPGKSRYI